MMLMKLKKQPQLQILDKREASILMTTILDRIKEEFFTNDDKLPQEQDSDNDDNINLKTII